MTGRSFIFGYSIISSASENAEKIINLCNEKALSYSKVTFEGENVIFSVPIFSERRLFKIAKAESIELTVISRRGLPALFLRHRHRVGLLVGLLVSLIFFIYSSGLVWDIRIDGAKSVNEKELLQTFSDCGLTVGAKLKDIDADVLENQILILSDKISWVSVNLSKNVANVEIREIDFPLPNEYSDAKFSNVIASQSGIIVGFEDINGSVSVDIGDAVCKDQLLISGILGGEGIPTTLTNAHGRVFAEVEDLIEIKIPQKYTKKVTKEKVNTEKSLIFFKNEIKFFSNSRNSPSTCDKINIIESFYTVNNKKLPLAIKTTKYIEYEDREFTRSSEEMLSLAYSELYSYINEHYQDADILSRSVSIKESEEELILLCNLRCVKNIAQIKEIIVS